MPVAAAIFGLLATWTTLMGIVHGHTKCVFEPRANMTTDQIMDEAGPGAGFTFEGDYMVVHKPGDPHNYMYFQKFVNGHLEPPSHDAGYFARLNAFEYAVKQGPL